MAFDENKYKKIFESRFGSGSFDSGLSQARDIGRLKAQADFAKKDYISRAKAAQAAAKKKSYNDAISYWNDPTNKANLRQDGAYRAAEKIKNDPNAQASIKDQGYNVSDYIDAMYNAASDGKYKSEREYNGFASQLNKDTKASNKAADQASVDKTGMTVQNYWDKVQKPAQDAQKKAQKQSKTTHPKGNPFLDALSLKTPLKWVDKNMIQPIEKNVTDRFATSAADQLTMGQLKKNINKMPSDMTPQFVKDAAAPAKNNVQKTADVLGGLYGAAAPIGGAYKLGTPIASALTKGVGNKLLNQAVRGGVSMGIYGVANQGLDEAINPNDATLGQRAVNVGENALFGAVADPALSFVGGKLASSELGQKIMNMIRSKNQPQQELLGLPAPQLRLNAPQLQLPGPKPVVPSLEVLNRLGRMPEGLQSPIPPIGKDLSRLLNENQPYGSLTDRLKHLPNGRQMADFSNSQSVIQGGLPDRINSLPTDRPLPDFGYGKQSIERNNMLKNALGDLNSKQRPMADFSNSQPVTDSNITNAYGITTPFDPMEHATPGYWKNRYEDFVNYVNNNYDTNNLSKPALEDLWSQFAKYNEPITLDQLAELAYKDVAQKPILDARNVNIQREPASQKAKNVLGIDKSAFEIPGKQKPINTKDVWNQLGSRPPVSNKAKGIMGLSKNQEFNITDPKQPIDPNIFKKILKQEPNLKDALKADPRINELVKKLYFKAPEPKVSRPATLQEMFQRLQDLAPPKQAPVEPSPLNFRVPKGFNPKLEPKILNRTDTSVKPSPAAKTKLAFPTILRSVKTKKTVNSMSKEELQTVYKQLEDKHSSLSKGKGNEQKIAAVQEDMDRVKKFLDLQFFGEKAPKEAPIPKPKSTTPVPKSEPISDSKTKVENIGPAPKGKTVPKENSFTKPQDGHGYGLIDLKAEAKAKAQTEMDKLLSNASDWKDKPKLLLKRETMTRNFEDIMGKDAPKMKNKFLSGISKGEADSVRFKNALREDIKPYKIKGYSKDSALTQMYGEEKISLDELKASTPNWKNVVKLTEHLRATYDELLPKMNEVLTKHGYDPVPFRKNYFPHQEDVSQFEKFLRDNVGIDLTDNTLPTEINGLTSQFKPGKQFFRNALQRKGDQTAYDAVLGFDKYVEGIANVIHHTENIKNLRSLDTAIRTKFDGSSKHLSNFASDLTEFTNNLAGKKSMIDRAIEDTAGRKAYNVLDTVRRKTGVNMVGANVSSALTNFIPLTHSLATTEKKAFVKGLTETMQSVIKDDGFINKSDFLTRRMGSDPLSSTIWEKTAHKSMALMRGFDRFTSQVIVRGKYNELIDKGIGEAKAIKQADDWAAKIMADRSKGSMPTIFNSKTLGLISQFQLEVNNQISFLAKDLPKSAKGKADVVSKYTQVLLYSYLFNNLYEKAVGRRPALDPIGIAFQAEKDYNNDHISKGKATKNLAGNVLNQLPFTSALTGGRIPISASIPDVMGSIEGTKDWKKEALKPLIYVASPAAGGQVKKTYEGLTSMNLNPLSKQKVPGDYAPGGKLRYPIEDNIQNRLKAGVFGKSSLPETQKYYEDNQKQLSDKQTKVVEQSTDPKATFERISKQRSQTTITNKIKNLQKNNNMSQSEKQEKLKHLLDQLKKLREGK